MKVITNLNKNMNTSLYLHVAPNDITKVFRSSTLYFVVLVGATHLTQYF